MNPLTLKKPCNNCPFRKHDAIDLNEGRLQGIVNDLVENDLSTFYCHKTVHSPKGGTWDDDEATYAPSGNEFMCAGAASYLMKIGRPTVQMRLGFSLKLANPSDWESSYDLVIDHSEINNS